MRDICVSVAELEWAPDGIGAERRDYLQSKADAAVFDDDMFYPSRWDVPNSTDPNDKATAAKRSAAPRTVYRVVEMFLFALIACVISV